MDCTARHTPELCGNKGCASDVPQNDPTNPDPRALKGYYINGKFILIASFTAL